MVESVLYVLLANDILMLNFFPVMLWVLKIYRLSASKRLNTGCDEKMYKKEKLFLRSFFLNGGK